MSGGVDSSVAAALLKEQGYEVIGITMCFNLVDAQRKRPACCGIQGIEDARRVAQKLGIKHYVLNMQKPLNDYVVKDFLSEYAQGRTPNPCVRCNQYLKFDALLKKALSLDAKFLATGHYARICHMRHATCDKPAYFLKKAKDLKKDQSYFLYRLNQEQLKHALFPIGNYTKAAVREMASKFGLSVAEKKGSQEICFLPQIDYRPFLEKALGNKIKPGPILDSNGNILGKHKGIAFYTIGQRQGLGIAKGYPIYVIGIDPEKNEITMGRKDEVLGKEFILKDTHLVCARIKKKIAVRVRIRYNHKEAAAWIIPFKGKLKVKFIRPQFAITPGQSAVFYKRGLVLGGGYIEKALN